MNVRISYRPSWILIAVLTVVCVALTFQNLQMQNHLQELHDQEQNWIQDRAFLIESLKHLQKDWMKLQHGSLDQTPESKTKVKKLRQSGSEFLRALLNLQPRFGLEDADRRFFSILKDGFVQKVKLTHDMMFREKLRMREINACKEWEKMNIPLGWPATGRLASKFGWRMHPVLHTTKKHEGVDISNQYLTEIRSTAGGVVAFSGYQRGYGKTIVVDHGNGYQTLYAHASRLKVRKGQRVHSGELLALMGSTGRSTGPHLHYEISYKGKKIDPLTMIN